jgi:hypothetical protein
MLPTLVPLAVRTCLVTLELHEVFQSRAILLSTISGRVGPPRHGGVRSCAVEDVSYRIAGYECLFEGCASRMCMRTCYVCKVAVRAWELTLMCRNVQRSLTIDVVRLARLEPWAAWGHFRYSGPPSTDSEILIKERTNYMLRCAPLWIQRGGIYMMVRSDVHVIVFNAMAVQAPDGYQRRYVTYSTGGCVNRCDATLTLGETSSHPNPRRQSHCLPRHKLGLQLAR